jgi:hypothetical protein
MKPAEGMGLNSKNLAMGVGRPTVRRCVAGAGRKTQFLFVELAVAQAVSPRRLRPPLARSRIFHHSITHHNLHVHTHNPPASEHWSAAVRDASPINVRRWSFLTSAACSSSAFHSAVSAMVAIFLNLWYPTGPSNEKNVKVLASPPS